MVRKSVLDNERSHIVTKGDSWHSIIYFDSFSWCKLITLEVFWNCIREMTSMINIVNLTNIKEIIGGEGIWTIWVMLHIITLLDLLTIEFWVKLVSKRHFNMPLFIRITKTQMIKLVCIIKLISLYIKFMDNIWITIPTDIKSSWYLINT